MNSSPDKGLIADCKSNGDNLKRINVGPVDIYSFSTPVIVRKRSYVTCDMVLGTLRGNFDIFEYDRDLSRCAEKSCSWLINEGGFSLKIGNAFYFQFGWP